MRITTTKISGSATSTGSFGTVRVATDGPAIQVHGKNQTRYQYMDRNSLIFENARGLIKTLGSTNLSLQTNSTAALTIQSSSQYVGIGTTDPSSNLEVKGTGTVIQKIVSTKIRNYYSPHDEVLRVADYWNWVDTPIGYKGAHGKTISKYSQTMVKPKNHRFASYAAVLRSFP